MNIKPEALLSYNKAKHINDDPYGQIIFKYAKQWSESMEDDLELLNTDKEIVEYLKENSTTKSMETPLVKDGLTGNQHDIANIILITTWKYGKQLYVAEALEKEEKHYHLKDNEIKHLEYYKVHGEILQETEE